MMILVIGRPDSGKSERAEELAMDMSAENERIYLATMIPFGEEGAERVARHRRLREGKSFLTLERAYDVGSLPDEKGLIAGIEAKGTTVLLEDAVNLCANLMFGNGEDSGKHLSAEEAGTYVVEDILTLKSKVRNMIVVSNEFSKNEDFDEDTIKYIDTVSNINLILKNESDRIYDITKGEWKIYASD